MNSGGCLTTQQLQAFLSGAATDASSRIAASHIETCASCAARVRELGGDPEAVLSSLRESTMALAALQNNSSSPTISSDPYRTRIDPNVAATAFSVLAPAQGPNEVGRLGHYRVLDLLGKGGMAFIFRAEDTSLHRPVALKVMQPELAADREGCIRFLREAQVMAAIQHDHVVTVHQVGQQGQTVFLAMELLSGEPLDRWMRENPRRLMVDVARIGKEIASGLSVIHEHGVVHRDIKPSNIWMKRKEADPPSRFTVKILDFGLAGLLKADTDLTASGIAIGTPAYMSPEQARGKKVDARSDLFSLGSVLYELAAGKKPFADDHTMAALTSLAIDTPPPVSEVNPLAPPALSDLIEDLLEKDPDRRPRTAQLVFEQLMSLEAELAGGDDTVVMRTAPKRPSRSRRRPGRAVDSWWTTSRLAAVAFIGAAALGFGFIAFSRPKDPEAKQSVQGKNGAMEERVGPIELDNAALKQAPNTREANAVYLAEMTPVKKEFYPFKHGDDFKKKPKIDDDDFKKKPKKDDDFSTVRVGGKIWPRGIFLHPPAPPEETSPASLTYKLDKKYRQFKAEVAINDFQQPELPQLFSVYGDGILLWRSNEVSSGEDRQPCAVSVKGVDLLKIEVRNTGDNPKGAHAVWLDPRVLP